MATPADRGYYESGIGCQHGGRHARALPQAPVYTLVPQGRNALPARESLHELLRYMVEREIEGALVHLPSLICDAEMRLRPTNALLWTLNLRSPISGWEKIY